MSIASRPGETGAAPELAPELVVAVVDDDEIALEYFRRLLRRARIGLRGYHVPQTALLELIQRPAPLLFVDYRMPRLDGLELIEALHAAGALVDARVWLCTAVQPPAAVVERATALGASILLKDRLIDRDWVLSLLKPESGG